MKFVDYVLRLQDKFSNVLGAASSNADKFEQKVTGLQSGLGKLAGIAAGAFSVAAIFNFGKEIVEAGANMEQTRVRFEALTGSAEKATAAIDNISKLATSTPFEKTDLLAYGQKLVTAGYDADTMATKLKMLGNISSATGKNLGELTTLYTKNKGSGILQGEDINQLADAGIALDGFAKQLGTNVQGLRKMGSEGKLTFQDLDKYFESLGGSSGKWGDLMDKQSKTLIGRWSNFKDTISQMMSDLGESKLDVFGGVLDRFQEVADWVSKNQDKIGNLFKPLMKSGQRLMEIFDQVRVSFGLTGSASDILDKVIVRLQDGMDYLGDLIYPIVDDLGSLWTSFTEIYAVIEKVYGAFNNGRTIGEGMKQSFREISVAIQVVVDGITTAVSGLARLGTSVQRMVHGDSMKDIVADNAKYADAMGKKWEGNFKRYQEILNPKEKNGGAVAGFGAADEARDAASKTKNSLDKKSSAAAKTDTKTTTKIGDVAGTKQVTIIFKDTRLQGIQNLYTSESKTVVPDLEKMLQEMFGRVLTDASLRSQNAN